MNKIKWTLGITLIIIVLIAIACVPKETPTPEPTATPTTAPTETPTEPPATAAPQAPASGGDPNEAVVVTPPEQPGACNLAPAIQEDDWVKGASAEEAHITIIEYSDFQCPGCGGMVPIVEALLEDNPDIRLAYRHFPLDFHPNAFLAAEATEAAGVQGKFWEMHDLLFARSDVWGALTAEELPAKLSEYAEELELDIAAFDEALAQGTYTDAVQADYENARRLGLGGTPSFIFNGVLFPSSMGLSYEGLAAFMAMLPTQQDNVSFDTPPEMTVSTDDNYEATLETSQGDIVIKLLPESAPTHVNSFVFLAQQDWYDGADFFFVRDDFAAVSGDPTNSTFGHPGYYCAGEDQGIFDRAGLLGMLSNGQFFITLGAEAAQLSGQFALVGQITQGLDVLDALARVTPAEPESVPDTVQAITIEKK